MARYGQITTVYEFGGADVWDLLEHTAYPLHLEGADAHNVVLGMLVTFDIEPEQGWAEPHALVQPEQLPDNVRAALQMPVPADISSAVSFMG